MATPVAGGERVALWSREQFEQAMRVYEGTVMAVVHDRYFIQRFATALWGVDKGQVRRYIDLEEWRRLREQAK